MIYKKQVSLTPLTCVTLTGTEDVGPTNVLLTGTKRPTLTVHTAGEAEGQAHPWQQGTGLHPK